MSGDAFGTWAVVEVMGHRRYAGYVTEQQVAGAGFVRVDVPEVADIPAHTRILGASAIFTIEPTSEAAARAAAEQIRDVPLELALERLEQRQLALNTGEDLVVEGDDGDDYAETFGDDAEQDD